MFLILFLPVSHISRNCDTTSVELPFKEHMLILQSIIIIIIGSSMFVHMLVTNIAKTTSRRLVNFCRKFGRPQANKVSPIVWYGVGVWIISKSRQWTACCFPNVAFDVCLMKCMMKVTVTVCFGCGRQHHLIKLFIFRLGAPGPWRAGGSTRQKKWVSTDTMWFTRYFTPCILKRLLWFWDTNQVLLNNLWRPSDTWLIVCHDVNSDRDPDQNKEYKKTKHFQLLK